ncbi:MAG: hypothetical protein IE931_07925 [Sphingobacteriales bacterium]|nr:hypothetical protein [Sphingobacteriales bacterium]
MKNLLAFPVIISAFALLSSCGNTTKTANQQQAEVKPANMKCYQAIDGADTAHLSVGSVKDKVMGELSFNFKEKQNNNGTIEGSYHGDTLFVDYSYKINGTNFKNPLVFLKEDSTFYQGYGTIITYLGRTSFDKKAPIDFTKGFVFKQTDCK